LWKIAADLSAADPGVPRAVRATGEIGCGGRRSRAFWAPDWACKPLFFPDARGREAMGDRAGMDGCLLKSHRLMRLILQRINFLFI
jgi:hypothetical protein